MRTLRAWLLRFGGLFGRQRRDRELADEMESHLQMHIEDNLQRGMAPAEARRQALIKLGGVEQTKENYRERRGIPFLETLLQDIRFASRMLRKSPGFTTVAVLTLALGIGANTAIFSVVNGVLLRPLPFPKQDRLMVVWEKDKDGTHSNTGFATYTDWKNMNHSFTGMAALSFWTPTLVTPNSAENLSGFRVSAPFFDILGVKMELGRNFLPAEDVRGQNFVAILSHSLWRSRFGADPHIVGKAITLGTVQYTVIGVLPADMPSIFSFAPRKPSEIYTPLAYNSSLPYACRDCRHLRVVARVRDDVYIAQANAEMNQISENLFRQYPKEYDAAGVILQPLKEYVVGTAGPILYTLFGSVGFVLLIACVNVANLLLGWAARRQREVAVRAAVGAGRTRLVRQFLTESLLLSFLGGTVGLVLATFGVVALQRVGPENLPRLPNVQVDFWVLCFTLGISCLTGLIFGVMPALRTSKTDLNEALKDGGKSTAGKERHRMRSLLVVADVALALILLAGAGLMMKSFVRLLEVNPGFDSSHVLTLGISLWGPKSADVPAVQFFQQMLDRVKALPGVESAAVINQIPLGGNLDMYGVHVEGKSDPNPERDPSADRYAISPDYLRTMRIPLLAGREFTQDDRRESPLVLIVNQTFVQHFWPGESAIGKRLKIGDTKGPWRTVVGVAGDVLHRGLDAPHSLQVYIPNTQWTDSDVLMVVRTANDATSIVAAVRQAIAAVDPQAPVSNVATMNEVVSASVAQQRFSVLLFVLFAVIALVLASVGIYGVISYAVAERTHEIGIRMALGAARSDVLRLVVGEGMKSALLGVAAGIAGALALTRLLANLLYGVKPNDPATFVAVSALLTVVALLACYIPARRAMRVDPMVALRYE